jgi:hypothetical protein
MCVIAAFVTHEVGKTLYWLGAAILTIGILVMKG